MRPVVSKLADAKWLRELFVGFSMPEMDTDNVVCSRTKTYQECHKTLGFRSGKVTLCWDRHLTAARIKKTWSCQVLKPE